MPKDFYDFFRDGFDDQMWKIKKEMIHKIRKEKQKIEKVSEMSAMYTELLHFENEFVESKDYTKDRKISILNSLIQFFLESENYEACGKVRNILIRITA